MNAAQIPDDVEFIKIAEVRRITSMSTTFIYEHMLDNTFPKQVRLGPRSVAWVKSEVQAWAQARIADSRPVGDDQSATSLSK
ncbi:AlpA family transcriptional regulator [Pseudomonas sp. S 311-6]|uniref:helix-turn-helix transcriptional regulator n=1 Tax=Pseudomonas TaxID=286 RepID=UPI002096BB46|nr:MULTISPECIES: AlpA family transcriptional regulator [Pseudomonas]MCO7567793.1 AlpA family transcriptional regulator [Pseudomonas mosselii]MCO7619360.1 AlpA family transcriptional regulator [Pseudomonas guariconensis]MCO7635184.1 AlpA family transcriptional regulator [Pseudomonas sp. S 311-6]